MYLFISLLPSSFKQHVCLLATNVRINYGGKLRMKNLRIFLTGGRRTQSTHLTPLVWVRRYEVDLSRLASQSRGVLKSVSRLTTI